MFNPRDPKHVDSLRTACKESRREQEPFYKHRLKALKELVGKHYSDHGTSDRRPLNLLELAATVYRQELIPSAPRAHVTPRNQQLLAQGTSFELALNQVLSADYVAGELEACVTESLFSPLGVIKVFQDVQDAVEIDGVSVWSGPPKLEAITHDNWVQDMSAGGPLKVQFCGDRYFLDREQALNDGMFDPDLVGKIPQRDTRLSDHDSQTVSRERKYFDDFRELIELWDIWLPDEGRLLTFGEDFDGPPLRTVEWSGPEPYERLFYYAVPGNSQPSPPVSMWMDLHDSINRLWNKLVRQAERQKTLDVLSAASAEDAKLIQAAKDGDILALSNVGDKITLSTGGIDNLLFAFTLQMKQLFSYMAGNLDSMAGLGAMSGTVGQDELLAEGASKRLRFMQSRVRDFLRRVFGNVGYHLWENTLIDIPIVKQSAGGPIESVWNRQMMGSEFPDYLIDIDPYSLQDRSPHERLAQLRTFWHEDMLQSAPLAQAQGIAPNFEEYARQYAKLSDLPEIDRLLMRLDGMQAPNDDPAGMPDTTTRKYVRSNRSTKTPGGQEMDLISKLVGAGNGQQT